MIRLKTLLSEQDTKKITVDIGDANKYCQVLRLTKADADYIVSSRKAVYSKLIDSRLAALETDLLGINVGFGKANPAFMQKYKGEIVSTSIEAKLTVKAEMSKYYTQLVYAACGLMKPIDTNQITINISNIIFNAALKKYNELFKRYNDSNIVIKKLARTAAKNFKIDDVKRTISDVVDEVENIISNWIDYTFMDFVSLGDVSISKYIEQKEKTAPLCDTVVIVRDKNYNPVKPYSPRKTYIEFDYMTNARDKNVNIAAIFLPKINTILDGLNQTLMNS